MQDSKGLPDDVPVADADEETTEETENVPLEATALGWQEQPETMDLGPQLEVLDRDG